MDKNIRKELERGFLRQMAGFTTKEQYEKIAEVIKGIPDDTFGQIIMEAANMYNENPVSLKDVINNTNYARSKMGLTPHNSAMNFIPVEFLTKKQNEELLKRIGKSHPSDFIKLTRESDSMLMGLWESMGKNKDSGKELTIPSDLFFAETIPLLDVKVSIDETMCENGRMINFRVVIYNDYAEKIRKATDDEVIEVGAVVYELGLPNHAALIMPIKVVRGVDVLLSDDSGYRNMGTAMRTQLSKHVTQQAYGQMFLQSLETWYGIQIALLHPVIRDVIYKPRIASTNIRPLPSQQKRKVKYMKHTHEYTISAEELDDAIYGGDKSFTRRALVWYVIGHWRTYNDGRKSFVKPYWKGALREIQMNLTEREREIAQAVISV
jgi:hypothetical protein